MKSDKLERLHVMSSKCQTQDVPQSVKQKYYSTVQFDKILNVVDPDITQISSLRTGSTPYGCFLYNV